MQDSDGRSIVGQAIGADGKRTTIKVVQGNYRGGIERIRVEGREELTCAENARDQFLLRLLHGEITLEQSPFIDLLWFRTQVLTRQSRPSHSVPSALAFVKLNDSQKQVAAAMISTTEDLVIAHGEWLRYPNSCIFLTTGV